MGVFSIRAVTTLEEFEALANPWNALLKQTASDNIFLTWEWLYTWAKHYLGDNRLCIILVYKQPSQLVGIAPFYIQGLKTKLGIVNYNDAGPLFWAFGVLYIGEPVHAIQLLWHARQTAVGVRKAHVTYVMVAGIFGFAKKDLFDLPDADAAQEPVKVAF